MKEWSLTETDFRIEYAQAYETLFTQGSGYLHIRGSLEEHLLDAPQNLTFMRMPTNVTAEAFPDTKVTWGTYVPGIYGQHPLLSRQMINLPYFLGLILSVEGEKLDMETCQITNYCREMDLHSAVLRRSLRWTTQAGVAIDVIFERYISAARPALVIQRMMVTSDRDIAIRIESAIDADVRTSGYDHFAQIMLDTAKRCLYCELTTDVGDTVDIASCLLSTNSIVWDPDTIERRASLVAEIPLRAGQTFTFEKRSAVATSRDFVKRAAADILQEAVMHSWEALLEEHTAIWHQRWQSADVEIEGDPASQLAIRVSLYHLLRVHVPDNRVAIDAKGYSGDAYFGRFFWDTEMYLLPFYLYTDPERARALVEYRVQSLDGARRNAVRYGYPGARYAWEADDKGDESQSCGTWQYRDHEIHITADVVYGIMHYVQATGDWAFLHDQAATVLVETARYWMERIDWRPGEDHPSLLGVMGPDEYSPITHNNSFTNRLVRFALEAASRWGESGGASPDERQQFAAIAATLPLSTAENGLLILQSEDFPALTEPDFDISWPDRHKPFAAQVSQEKLYRTKCLKQADVLLLMMLFPGEFSIEQVQRAWDYYLPLTTHDSSLSLGVHAVMAARLGLTQHTWDFWQETAMLDLHVERGHADQGIHIANCGANWQVIVSGFAGIQFGPQFETLVVKPALPQHWQRLAFSLVWHGCPVQIEITQDQVLVTNRGQHKLNAVIDTNAYNISPKTTATHAL
jgi:trehalose/maltose hydrolase-like predicted phosphorylase